MRLIKETPVDYAIELGRPSGNNQTGFQLADTRYDGSLVHLALCKATRKFLDPGYHL